MYKIVDESAMTYNRYKLKKLFVIHSVLFFILSIFVFIFEDDLIAYRINNFLDKYFYGNIFLQPFMQARLAFKLNWYFSIFISFFTLVSFIFLFCDRVFYNNLFGANYDKKNFYSDMKTLKVIGYLILHFLFVFALYYMSFTVYIFQDETGLTVKKVFDNLFYNNIFSATIMLYLCHLFEFIILFSTVVTIVYLKIRFFKLFNMIF